VEDQAGIFRFDYPVNLIRWALCVPNYVKDWHIGVKATGNGKLLAFISGTPIKTIING
jgi:glycylpeptide N-tetradecanoyltransferase